LRANRILSNRRRRNARVGGLAEEITYEAIGIARNASSILIGRRALRVIVSASTAQVNRIRWDCLIAVAIVPVGDSVDRHISAGRECDQR
jgi:hypothetical protein